MSTNPLMLLSSFIVACFSAYFAYKKGKNPYLWFFIGLLFGVFGIFAFFFASNKKPIPKVQKQEPIFVIQGPKDKFWYYLDADQKQQGPISHAALTTAWKQGKVSHSTYIWHEELSEWQELKNLLTSSP